MNKKEKLAFAVVAALAMTSGGFAVAQTINPVSSDQVINACVTGVNGNITKVSNTQKTCPKGTTPISWNKTGPQGNPGIQGIQGPKGDSGVSYLDEEVIINESSASSWILQVGDTTEGYQCWGATKHLVVQIGNRAQTNYCLKEIPSSGIVTFLDVESAGVWSGEPAALAFFVLPFECPSTSLDMIPNVRQPEGWFVRGTEPFGFKLSGQSNCLVLSQSTSIETGRKGLYHIAAKVSQD